MVKASGQIEQELGALQQRTEEMSRALEPLYEGYLKALSEASGRQLMQAAYHLCTQAYPDKFLALSWDQRNQLQKAFQVLSAKIYDEFLAQRDRAKKMSRRPQQHSGLEFLQRLLEARTSGIDIAKLSEEQPSKKSQPDDEAQEAPKGGIEEAASGTGTETTHKHSSGKGWKGESSSSPEQETTDFSDDLSELESLRLDPQDNSDLDPQDNSNTDLNTELDSAGNFIDSVDAGSPDAGDLNASDLDAGNFNETEPVERERDKSGFDSEDDFDFEMEVPAADQRLTLSEEEDLLSALEGLARRGLEQSQGTVGPKSVDDDDETPQPLVPLHLVKQQVFLEKAIRDVFVEISEQANELLQKAAVMPSFPKALLAAAADSYGMGESVNSVPNVVKLSVRVMHGEALLELGEEDDEPEERAGQEKRKSKRPDDRVNGAQRSEDRAIRDDSHGRASRFSEEPMSRSRRQKKSDSAKFPRNRASSARRIIAQEAMPIEALPELAAISLRLSEVEFTDPTVSAWRSRLRQKLSELKQLGSRYKKTQRALETAQAEDAWRSSWTVHNPSEE
ncbi:MAG: hypothetical protein AAF050_04345 [Cyanobacteria bacterium J06649_5]